MMALILGAIPFILVLFCKPLPFCSEGGKHELEVVSSPRIGRIRKCRKCGKIFEEF